MDLSASGSYIPDTRVPDFGSSAARTGSTGAAEDAPPASVDAASGGRDRGGALGGNNAVRGSGGGSDQQDKAVDVAGDHQGESAAPQRAAVAGEGSVLRDGGPAPAGALRRLEAESEIAPAGKASSDAEAGTDVPPARKLSEGAGAGEPSVAEALTPHEQLASIRSAMSLSWIEEDAAASAATQDLSTTERIRAYCPAAPALPTD